MIPSGPAKAGKVAAAVRAAQVVDILKVSGTRAVIGFAVDHVVLNRTVVGALKEIGR